MRILYCYLVTEIRVLTRSDLMTLYIIFPIHLNFPIRSRCVIIIIIILIGIYSMQGWTATTRHGITRKANTKRLRHTGNLFSGLFYNYFRKFFLFQKDAFYDIVHACGIWLISPFCYDLFLFFLFLYLSYICFFSA